MAPRFPRWFPMLALATLLPVVSLAAPPAKARHEIDRLIALLGSSGCEFQRNGRWYPAGEARVHLQRKYDYLLKRDLVDSAEEFIERAGSQSSMSGKAYSVRCPGKPTVPSAQWLGARLSEIRHAAP
ncbi:DUF5329 domain-containing protein [Lysobacter sp. LF1]|uniref:DUF5329 domain-containing protein n=2 Tax=Lysobacter stagni TaxID=3045172 RepID=A0ABT6XHG0_9GAMM|nr:DUF5329 domain-containing protein [Lysobacter sp. LF1]MDI9239592.1 DUF5329 domain-containing protein [Lysobacter sp. LF1]